MSLPGLTFMCDRWDVERLNRLVSVLQKKSTAPDLGKLERLQQKIDLLGETIQTIFIPRSELKPLMQANEGILQAARIKSAPQLERAAAALAGILQQLDVGEKFLGTHPSLDEAAAHLAGLDDREFLTQVFSLFGQEASNRSLTALLMHPRIKVRLFRDINALPACLERVADFFLTRLGDPLLNSFLSDYLASCLTLVNLKTGAPFPSVQLPCLQELYTREDLSPSLRHKVQLLLDLFQPPPTTPRNLFDCDVRRISREERGQEARWNSGLTPSKRKAIDASFCVEGYECRPNGIKQRVHQKPGPDALVLVLRQIREFTSGRRNFRFMPENSVEIQNYKVVMLYCIRAIREDKAQYYSKHPGYIQQEEYKRILPRIEAGEFFFDDASAKYLFEYFSEKLFALEKKIATAQREEELEPLLESFRDIYRRIPNENMNLTVVTCIDYSVFYRQNNYKPVITNEVPAPLLELKEMLGGKWSQDSSLEQLFQPFNEKAKTLPDGVESFKESFRVCYEAMREDKRQFDEKVKPLFREGIDDAEPKTKIR